MANTIRVAVTGAAGQVAYAMLGRLASGEVFGPQTRRSSCNCWKFSRRWAPSKASPWNWTTAASPPCKTSS